MSSWTIGDKTSPPEALLVVLVNTKVRLEKRDTILLIKSQTLRRAHCFTPLFIVLSLLIYAQIRIVLETFSLTLQGDRPVVPLHV